MKEVSIVLPALRHSVLNAGQVDAYPHIPLSTYLHTHMLQNGLAAQGIMAPCEDEGDMLSASTRLWYRIVQDATHASFTKHRTADVATIIASWNLVLYGTSQRAILTSRFDAEGRKGRVSRLERWEAIATWTYNHSGILGQCVADGHPCRNFRY